MNVTNENGQGNNTSNVSGGDEQNSGGNSEKNQENLDKTKENSVSYETYSKLLSETKKAKDTLRELQENLNRANEEKMKADGDWKGLLEARENRIKELETKNSELDSRFNELNSHVSESKKLSKVLSKLGGGLDEKYFGLIDLEEIKVNPETGQIDELSVSEVAEKFKQRFPETLKSKVNPRMMGDGKSGDPNQSYIKYSDWLALKDHKEMSKWKKSQIIE